MTTTMDHKPKTVFMPVITMEEVPVLQATERAALIASIHQAEGEMASGKFVIHDSKNFMQDMTGFRSAALITKVV